MVENIERGKQLLSEFTKILQNLSDEEASQLLDPEQISTILVSILSLEDLKKYNSIADFLLANKGRATTIAIIQRMARFNYGIKAEKDGTIAFVSPYFEQWFDDGVLFLEGKSPFMGILGYYTGKDLKYAIAARDAKKGERMGRDHFLFISMDDYQERLRDLSPEDLGDLDKPIRELHELLDLKDNEEAKYQTFFSKYPWIFGLQYSQIQDLRTFNDQNIPDFTGIRVRDGYRDIIEIKPPFTPLFTVENELNASFNNDWNQTERYLNFARQNKDYLAREKGLNFDNPQCYLISGYNLSEQQIGKIRIKERMNPAINFLTYNDLLAFMTSTISFIKQTRASDRGS